MKQTIYVDVLIIINIYINYGLLLLTGYLRKNTPERLKILFAALFGGLYSLIILVPDVSDLSVSVSRIPALCFMAFLAFGYKGIKAFISTTFSLLLVNIVFAGVMFMLWFFIYPENMYYNSGVVYFDIDALTLVIMTIGAYAVIRIIMFLTRGKVPLNFTYLIKLYVSDKEISCRGFYDSGNGLYDPFSGDAVTIVSYDTLKDIINEDIFFDFEKTREGISMKLIPIKSVSGTNLLPSFRADKMIIKSVDGETAVRNPIIAVCREKIHGGDYGVILHSSVFENNTCEKGDNYVLCARKNYKEDRKIIR